MYPRGVIYQFGVSKRRGVISIKAPLGVRVAYFLFRGLGAGFIGFAVMAFVFTFGPPIKEELNYQLVKKDDLDYLEQLKFAQAQKTSDIQEEAKALGLDSYFSLYIPKLEAKAKIISNVDPTAKEEYLSSLQKGVAHARGTHFPGQGSLIYLFAHSTDSPVNFTRYNAVFYLLSKLEQGDIVTVYFADKKYVYRVSDKVLAKAEDTSWLTKEYGEEVLVLQTCDPPGTTWNRLLVIAKPIP